MFLSSRNKLTAERNIMNYFEYYKQKKQLGVLLLKSLLLVLLVFLVGAAVSAQDKIIPVVKGTVRNTNDEVLMGVTVFVQGKNIYTTTKKDGSFEISNVPEEASLRFSYVGYIALAVKLKPGQSEVAVKLSPAANVMGEVVVNAGLYKRPVGNFTGAAKAYSGEELKMINPTNALKALAAIDPSIRIQENNIVGSDPNQLPVIQLRGQNNLPVSTQGVGNTAATPVSNGDIMSNYLSNPNQPLIILDGFQTTLQTLYDLDINRIASITVLKDAAATTAYGSKAANGVIVVETRQPVAGRTQVSYSFNMSTEVPDLSSYHLLDAKGLLEAQRLAGIYSDPTNHYNDLALKQWYDYRLQQVQSGVNTDWLSQPVRTGFGTSHSLNVTGGSKAVRYALSLNYGNSSGVMKGSERDRFGLNYNLSYVTKDIHFSNSTTVNYNRGNNTPWGSFSQYASQFPYFRKTDSLGNPVKIFEPTNTSLGFLSPAPGGIFTNAAYNAQLAVKDNSYYFGLTNNTNFDWTLSNSLRMRSSLSFSNNLPGADQFYPADHTNFVNSLDLFNGLGSYTQTRGKNAVVDGKLAFDYNKRIGAHTFLAAVGTEVQATTTSSTTVSVYGMPNDYIDQLGMADGYGNSLKPNSQKGTTHSISSFASASYNYLNKYTVEVTANASGSSQFGSNNRFAPFWAGGLGWNLDKEKFFIKNPVIQQLRVRATTGITGNQNFAAYLGQPIYQYNTLNNYRLQLGANPQGYANPNLKWQQTIKNNLGFVAGLFKGRLNVSVDLFEEKTNNLILPLDIAPSTGFSNYQDNLGATKNSGYEISVTAPLISNARKNIFWSLTFNAGHYTNVITELSPAIAAYNKTNDTAGVKQLSPLPKYVVGQSMTRIWAVRSLGIDPATGKEIFVKLDGSKTFVWDPLDKVPCGDAAATIKGMFGSNLTYKGFTINIIMSYQYGGKMYNQTLVDKIENVNLLTTNADERVLTDRWKQPGDHVSYKALVPNGANGLQYTYATSRFVEDDDYLEATSITVGYTFPSNLEWVHKLRLSTPRLFVTQNNAFRFATIKTERGTGYPFSHTFNFGLSTSF
ncbi:MAG: SusC/RagA family TonB-linked outer membrane protein [Flavisolibacter sp.]